MQKILFIDRDGTIIHEPESDKQVDSLEKLHFIPKVITNLHKIAASGIFKLVMVTNQDGLGTSAFPEENFWPAHNKMLEILKGEGIIFNAIHIDRTFPDQKAKTRKPGIGLLRDYMNKNYDLANSFVIGDRQTDIELAQNLGAQAIYFAEETIENTALCSNNWDEIFRFLMLPKREVQVARNTRETAIRIYLNLDGSGIADIQTGLGFYDHMLEQLAKHSGADLKIRVEGDLHIDEHHTIEDTALALGEAYLKALGDKKGIERYGFLLPMDDSLARVAVDFSGRPWLVWNAEFKREKIGDMPTEMFYHFFKSFADASKSNINIQVEGSNEHHKIEAIFKAFAKSVKMAVKRDPEALDELPSTKGTL